MQVNIKNLIGYLNEFCKSSLEGAAGNCVAQSHYEVSMEHLLFKFIEDADSDITYILNHFEIDISLFKKNLQFTLEGFKSGNTGKPVFSPLLLDWFQDSWLLASIDYGQVKIRSGILLLSFLGGKFRYLADSYINTLGRIEIDILRKNYFDIISGSKEDIRSKLNNSKGAIENTNRPNLKRFTVDFTELALSGKIDPVFGRDNEIRQMIEILARRRKNNPIIVGEAGVGKTAVVEGLALNIINNDVPSILKGVKILGLDMGLLQAGAGMKGEFENRIKSVINEIKSSTTPIILFIDEVHTVIGAGGQAGGSDAANLLKPILARGELRTIAATTWVEYKKYFEKDQALSRRFQLVKLEEPSQDAAIIILRGLKEKYEKVHNVYIKDDAIIAAVKLSHRYIAGRQLPDKAIDLLDTASARVKIGFNLRPFVIEKLEKDIQRLKKELNAYERDEVWGDQIEDNKIADLEKEIKVLEGKHNIIYKKWEREKDAVNKIISIKDSIYKSKDENKGIEVDCKISELNKTLEELDEIQGVNPLMHPFVDEDVVAKVVSDWTGIPLGKMIKDEAKSISNFDKFLKKEIKGQDHAIDLISKNISIAKAGISNPNQPIAVFLLVGPSGVGKTELSHCMADLIFGGSHFLTTINMSEFQEKHTVSRLIGSPPGYIGYGEGGILTEAVRKHPYSAVLLDEVEKADKEVLNLFYQVFDKGILADGEGRIIDFKNTVIIMTSNLASDIVENICQSNSSNDPDDVIKLIRPTLVNHFKPALLARMTIIPFYTINQDAMKDIVGLKLKNLKDRFYNNNKLTFQYDEKVVGSIINRCTEVESGARNIDHIINEKILPEISKEILLKMSEQSVPEKIRVSVNKDNNFIFEF